MGWTCLYYKCFTCDYQTAWKWSSFHWLRGCPQQSLTCTGRKSLCCYLFFLSLARMQILLKLLKCQFSIAYITSTKLHSIIVPFALPRFIAYSHIYHPCWGTHMVGYFANRKALPSQANHPSSLVCGASHSNFLK